MILVFGILAKYFFFGNATTKAKELSPKPIGFRTGEKLFSNSTSLSLNDSTILDALF